MSDGSASSVAEARQRLEHAINEETGTKGAHEHFKEEIDALLAAHAAAQAQQLKEIEQAIEGRICGMDGTPRQSLVTRIKVLVALADKCAATECVGIQHSAAQAQQIAQLTQERDDARRTP